MAQQAQLQVGGVAAPPAAPPAPAAPAPAANPMPAPTPVATPAPAAAEEEEEADTLPSNEKTTDGCISRGQAVMWSGKQGTVRYIGPAKFAEGEWLGVELVAATGMHEGNVMGVQYFTCAPKCGVMAQQ